jgi:hypothetical protein
MPSRKFPHRAQAREQKGKEQFLHRVKVANRNPVVLEAVEQMGIASQGLLEWREKREV